MEKALVTRTAEPATAMSTKWRGHQEGSPRHRQSDIHLMRVPLTCRPAGRGSRHWPCASSLGPHAEFVIEQVENLFHLVQPHRGLALLQLSDKAQPDARALRQFRLSESGRSSEFRNFNP